MTAADAAPPARRPASLVALLAGVAALAAVLAAPGAGAGVVEDQAELPAPTHGAPAVWTGDEVLAFGGCSDTCPTDAVRAWDPATGNVTRAGTLPTALVDAAAAFHARETDDCPEGCAYLFGGRDANGTRTDAIVRVDAATGGAERLDARLPRPMDRVLAVGAGDTVYLFGGRVGDDERVDTVLRYDVDQDALETLNVSLPDPTSALAGAWDPRPRDADGCPAGCAYLLGGTALYGAELDTVLRFDPTGPTLEAVDTALPDVRSGARAVFDGERVLTYGGYVFHWDTDPQERYRDGLLAFDPTTDEVLELPEPLAPDRGFVGAAWTGDATAIVGGRNRTGGLANVTHHYPPGHGPAADEHPPEHLDVQRPPGMQTVNLTWDAPANRSFPQWEVLTGFGGQGPSVAETVNQTQATATEPSCEAATSWAVRGLDDEPGHRTGHLELPTRWDPDEMLCKLNDRLRFDEGAIDDDGEDAPPPTREAIREAEENGTTSNWYGTAPFRMTCCETVAWTPNPLEDDTPAQRVDLQGLLAEAADGDRLLTPMLDDELEDRQVTVTGNGFRAQGVPQAGGWDTRAYLDLDVGGHARIDDPNGRVREFAVPNDGVAELADDGRLIHDVWDDEAERSSWLPEDAYRREDPQRLTVQVDGHPVRVPANVTASYETGGWVEAGVGLDLPFKERGADARHASTVARAQGRGDVTAVATVPGTLNATLSQRDSLIVTTGSRLSIETVDPEEGMGGLESHNTYIDYGDLEHTVHALRYKGPWPSTPDVQGQARLYDFVDLPASAEPREVDPPNPAVALAAEATLAAPNATVTLVNHPGAPSGQDALTVPPAAQDLLVRLDGAPGATVDARLERPMPSRHAGLVVTPWSVDLPRVHLGDDGTATLHLDTLGLQEAYRTFTWRENPHRRSADAALRGLVDADGDGTPAPEDDAIRGLEGAPLSLDLGVEGPPSGKDAPAVGRPVALEAHLSDPRPGHEAGGSLDGTVAFRVDGERVATATPDANGTARATVPTPDTVLGDDPAAWTRVEARYLADADRTDARAAEDVRVRDPAPELRFSTPGPLEALGGEPRPAQVADRPSLPVDLGLDEEPLVFEATNSTDLDHGSAEVRVDGGDWRAAEHADGAYRARVDVGPEGLELDEGFHTVSARLADDEGQTSTITTTFVVDRKDPEVDVETEDRVNDGRFEVTVSADEPVAVRLNASGPVERVAATETFAEETTLELKWLWDGVYTWRVEVLDTAGEGPIDPTVERERVFVASDHAPD